MNRIFLRSFYIYSLKRYHDYDILNHDDEFSQNMYKNISLMYNYVSQKNDTKYTILFIEFILAVNYITTSKELNECCEGYINKMPTKIILIDEFLLNFDEIINIEYSISINVLNIICLRKSILFGIRNKQIVSSVIIDTDENYVIDRIAEELKIE